MRRSRLLISALFYLIGFALLFLVILPMNTRRKDRQTALDSLETRLASAKKERDEARMVDDAIKTRPKDFLKLDSMIPQGDERHIALAIVSTIADESKITIESIGFRGASDELDRTGSGNTIHTLPVAIDGKGGYGAIKNFIFELERQVRVADIGALALSPAGEGRDIYQFQLSLNVYFQSANRD
ncbi:MAG: hypothetical protein HY460_01775 [Parcubacteria group bacterium]|nr:hypothetical protein [Parcubacteria group bacterium]